MEEKPLWKHEWLEMLVNRELDAESSESSSSGIEDEAEDLSFEYIRKWQEGLSVEAVADYM